MEATIPLLDIDSLEFPARVSFQLSLGFHAEGVNVGRQIQNRERTSMAEIGRPPFGYVFDPDELVRLYHEGASAEELARIGLPTGH